MAGSTSGRSLRLLSTKGLLPGFVLSAHALNLSNLAPIISAAESAATSIYQSAIGSSATSTVDSAAESTATSTIDSTADSTTDSINTRTIDMWDNTIAVNPNRPTADPTADPTTDPTDDPTTDPTANSTIISSGTSTTDTITTSTSTSKSKPDTSDNASGPCKTYVVASGDTCESIAKSNDISSADITDYNAKTWGWSNCDGLTSGLKICVSAGTPPMPAPVDGAQCGPVKPGSTAPAGDQSLAEMNPCPLNACCMASGFCGNTPDFCTAANGSLSGCISNCGEDIKQSDAPDQFATLGFYQTWSRWQPCASLNASNIDTSKYTHLAWAFVQVNKDLSINNTDTDQWSNFLALPNVKKIVSVGGWLNDASPRLAAQPENVDKAVDNINDYVNKYNLDGVDIDWEFPQNSTEAQNLLVLLQKLRGKLSPGKLLATDIPSAYDLLSYYPLVEMSKTVDFITLMAYDYHAWTDNRTLSGCNEPTFNCIRSHVNLTETDYTLSMLTKAGVPSNKISVGVASYGKSYVLSDPSCVEPSCTYDRIPPPKSACNGLDGQLTNSEINKMISDKSNNEKTFHDDKSDSDVLTYDADGHTIWVGYMNDQTKAHRKELYKSENFWGTTDWAIDMNA